jgi:hypothetical protein
MGKPMLVLQYDLASVVAGTILPDDQFEIERTILLHDAIDRVIDPAPMVIGDHENADDWGSRKLTHVANFDLAIAHFPRSSKPIRTQGAVRASK